MSQVINQVSAPIAGSPAPVPTTPQSSGLLFLYAETQLHAGTGASLGVVDLPIQRERTTEFPKIQSSAVKGVLRAETETRSQADADLLYGPKVQDYAGALALTDARILLFPVRSLSGLFTWITCPTVLARLLRDLKLLSHLSPPAWKLGAEFSNYGEMEALVAATADNPPQAFGPIVTGRKVVALEEFLFTPKASANVSQLATWLADNALPDGAKTNEYQWWYDKLATKKHLAVLKDEDFRDFVTSSTEVVARIKLNQTTKTASDTGLWYQEFLPGETVLYSVAVAQDARDKTQRTTKAADVWKKFKSQNITRIQIGGDETTGKGFCHLRYL